MGRDRHGSRAPAPYRNRGHRSRSVAALARRAAGAFLLATFALLAFAPGAEANHNPAPPTNPEIVSQTTTSITFRFTGPSNLNNINWFVAERKRSSESNWGGRTSYDAGSLTNVLFSRAKFHEGSHPISRMVATQFHSR